MPTPIMLRSCGSKRTTNKCTACHSGGSSNALRHQSGQAHAPKPQRRPARHCLQPCRATHSLTLSLCLTLILSCKRRLPVPLEPPLPAESLRLFLGFSILATGLPLRKARRSTGAACTAALAVVPVPGVLVAPCSTAKLPSEGCCCGADMAAVPPAVIGVPAGA
jgi:hypothetical protein